MQLFVAPWNTPHQASLSVTYSLSSRRHMSIKRMMPSIHFILCRSLLLLIQIPPIIRDFYELNLCVRWPMYWSFSFSISPPKNTLDWSPYGWTDGICLQSKGLSRIFSNTTVQKHQVFLALSFLHSPNLTSIHHHWKNHSIDFMDFLLQNNVSAL